jgi:hypothetical protein
MLSAGAKAIVGLRPSFSFHVPDFLHGAAKTRVVAFIKESRMKFAKATRLDRKSGVRFGERGAPVCLV